VTGTRTPDRPRAAPGDRARTGRGEPVSPARPGLALAMLPGMLPHTFTPAQLDRLRRVTRVLSDEPLGSFDGEDARAVLAEVEVLVGHWGCPTLTAEVLDAAPRLRLFAYAAGTVKWQVTEAVFERGIVVTSAAAANAVPVAEYALAMILLANKGVLGFREQLRSGARPPLEATRVGNRDKVVGIVGASHVGRRLVELLRPFELTVLLYDPYLGPDDARRLGVELVTDLDELCARADVLSLHAPDVPATRGMIGAAQLARLRDGATFLNTARPALVDQEALLTEARTGRLQVILDVTDPEPLPPGHPLLGLPNVFVTPHVAGSMGSELPRMAELAVQEVERFVTGAAPLHPVRREDLDRIA